MVAHYNLLERLEPSGPGDLYRARDTRLGRTVTLRLLPADFTPGAAARAELIAQAQSMTSLSHPNVITLFDAGEHDGRVFLAFEFLQGQSLREEMAGQHMNLRRAVETSVQIADAIAAAHATGFVHGGLSPESVSVTARGHAKMPAFGWRRTPGSPSPIRRPARLRLARGDAGPDPGRPVRHLLGGRDPLRDADGTAAEPARVGGAQRVEPRTCRPSSTS